MTLKTAVKLVHESTVLCMMNDNQFPVCRLWARLTVVSLSGDGALSGRVAVLVAPLPVDATDDPRPRDDVLHHLGTKQAALATKVRLSLLHSFTCEAARGMFTSNIQRTHEEDHPVEDEKKTM